ncbi:MAG: iron uptake porin [Elainellaceae cyanobacterium]
MNSKFLRHSLLVVPVFFGMLVVSDAEAIASEIRSDSGFDSATDHASEILGEDIELAQVADRVADQAVDVETDRDAGNQFESSDSLDTHQIDPLETESLEDTADAIEQLDTVQEKTSIVSESSEESNEDVLDQVQFYNTNGDSASLGQVTSISQLSDVQPTDWAFQALQSLVERYGCIAGYPDGTYRGNRAMTRYEFAAGMNACLDRINELIAAGLADVVTREDLAVLQRLQEEFAAELATLRGRVDALEARVAEVEANQFSTTTKLEGEVQFLVSAIGVDDGNVTASGDDIEDGDQAVFIDRVRLNFITSFTGEDELETSLEAGNFENDIGDTFPGDPLGFNAGGDEGNNFDLDDLIYTFTLFDRAEILIGATGLDIDDPVNDITPLSSSSSGSISEFGDVGVYEQAFPGSGAGIGASVALIENDDFAVLVEGGYVADDPSDPEPGSGLFNGDYAAIGQLTFESDLVDVGLTYVNSYSPTSDLQRIDNVYDVDGPAVANTYGGAFNFKLFDNFLEVGGSIAFSQVNGIGALPDYEAWTYQGTLALNDLLVEGARLGVVGGVPTYTRDLDGQSTDTGFLVEGFYSYPINDFITITPSVIYIDSPFNVDDNDDVIIGTLRTVFKF